MAGGDFAAAGNPTDFPGEEEDDEDFGVAADPDEFLSLQVSNLCPVL